MKYFLIIIGVLVLFVVIYMVIGNIKTPDLGVENGRFKPLSNKPNGVSTQSIDLTKRVEPLLFDKDLETSKALILEACDLYGGAKIITEENNYLHIVFTTGTMKFNDDVEFYFDTENQIVHYRSQSRVGYSDMGLNQERYNTIKKHYEDLKEAK